jgi:hypothetical protein
MALLAALAIGAFVSFGMSQLFPTIDTARVLREIGARPVLGIISLRADPAALRRRRLSNIAFGGAVSALLVVFGAWITWIGVVAPV